MPEPGYPLTMAALLWDEARSGAVGRGAGPARGTVSLAQPVGWVSADLASSYQPHHPLSCLTKTPCPYQNLVTLSK